MSWRARILAPLFGSILALPAQAAENLPSLELLEFLGEWGTEESGWLGPELFEEALPEEELEEPAKTPAPKNEGWGARR